MSFEGELQAAFGEVEQTGMPLEYTMTNHKLFGIVRTQTGNSPMMEPGFQDLGIIVIVSTVGQFDNPPQGTAREVVQITSGPYAGTWSCIAVSETVAHYELTCQMQE